MALFTLYTYQGIHEFRKIQLENEIKPFVFAETADVLSKHPAIVLDISTLIHYLRVTKSDRMPAYANLREMTSESIVIVEKSLSDDAVAFFPYLFSCCEPYFEQEDQSDDIIVSTAAQYVRQSVYTYDNIEDLKTIIDYSKSNFIPIATFSCASGYSREEFERFNKSAELAILDLTSVSYTIEDNKNLIYLVEQFLNLYPNIRIITQTSQIDNIIKYFPLYFDKQEPITYLLPKLKDLVSKNILDEEVRKVTSLSNKEFLTFIDYFNHNLIGHNYFKERLAYFFRNFIALNRAKDQRIFSIFLFGASGIGKTEVARLIASGLQNDNTYLAKINFQNYSSQDALNSLIGSPAGYIGCNHGELSDKVQKSKVGVVLCDEFEKTTRPVFSFFLELLEEGRFTDSMAREYDLDGYIIVFTSNIQKEAEYKKIIPSELQTRFDLVCEFQEPTLNEKIKFLDLLLERAELKYSDLFSKVQMTQEEKNQLYNFDCSSLTALRDIKRVFNNRLMDFFESKGVF